MYHFFQNILKNAEERNIARTLPYTVPVMEHQKRRNFQTTDI